MTATETTKKPFDNISRKLTFKDLLLTSFSGSLFNTAMVIVAPIFIFLAIIWLYYRNYYFKALGIMKTVGLLVSSGILFGVTFKVLLTTIRVFAGSYGCVNCSNVKLILTLFLTVSIMFLSLSLLFRKESHKNIGLLPKQVTATDKKVGTVKLPQTDKKVGIVNKDTLAKAQAAHAALAQAVRDIQIDIAQAVRDAQAQAATNETVEKAAQAAQAAQAVLAKAQAALDAQAALAAQAAQAAQDALAQAVQARKAALDEKAVLDEKSAQAAQAVFEKAAQAVRDALAQAQAAQAVLKQAVRDAQAQAATVATDELPPVGPPQAALNAQKTPQGQTAVSAGSASLQTAENN
ncbi:hypothetical protein GINT2_001040 [Glugoides intestinalis]